MKKPLTFLVLQGALLSATAGGGSIGDAPGYPPLHRRVCLDIWIGRDVEHDVGEICMHVDSRSNEVRGRENSTVPSTQETTLILSYNLFDNWSIHESYAWLGTSLSEMPRLHSRAEGPPSLQEFPFVDWQIREERDYEVQIPILQDFSSLPDGCASFNSNQRMRYYLAVHPVILQQHNQEHHTNSTVKSPPSRQDAIFSKQSFQQTRLRSSANKSLHAANITQKQTGIWWMEFSFDLDCSLLTAPNLAKNNTKNNSSLQDQNNKNNKNTHALTSVRQERRLFSLLPKKRSNELCDTSTINEEATNKILTENELYQFHIASELAVSVSFKPDVVSKVDYYRTIYERFDAFDDGVNDAAVIAKVDQTCYAVFRGTIEYSRADVAQNFVPGYRRVPDTDCYVRRGYYDAYFTSYKEEFETKLRHCVDSCQEADENGTTGEPCQVILSGGSQGGANAIVASIALFEEYDPYVFSFGVPRVFLPTSPFDDDLECKSINRERQYHFLLTDSLLKVYDPVPYYPAYFTKYEGREILFDGDGNFNDQGLSTSDTDKYHLRRSPTSIVIHTRWNYYIKSKQAYENACLPIPVRGWRDGHWCTEDSNCQTTSYCAPEKSSQVCAPRRAAGELCDTHSACLSGSCDNHGMCDSEPKLRTANGEACFRGTECESGRCDGFWGFSTCQERLASGHSCNEHTDCLSGLCVGLINGKCL